MAEKGGTLRGGCGVLVLKSVGGRDFLLCSAGTAAAILQALAALQCCHLEWLMPSPLLQMLRV